MDPNVLITFIIILGIVLIVVLLSGRLTKLAAWASIRKGEGGLNIEAAKPKSTQPQPSDQYSVNISGNVAQDRAKIIVSQDNVNVEDNTLTGGSEINVGQISTKKSDQ
jgi:hypothetical protein